MTYFYNGPEGLEGLALIERWQLRELGIEDPREFDGEADYYTDDEAFETGIGVCYIPENGFTCYTRQDFLDLVDGDERRAKILYHACNWQSPETLLDEEERDHCLFGEPEDEDDEDDEEEPQ